MWKWLSTVFGWAIGAVGGPQLPVLHDIFKGVWGWLSSVFGNVGKAWTFMFRAGSWIHLALEHFHINALAVVWDIIHIRIPQLIRWVLTHIERIWTAITHLAKRLEQDVINLILRIATAIDNAIKWVRDHIWTPLKAFIDTIFKWIHDRGEVLWFYLTHPGKLAALLFDELIALLEKEAWNVGALLGKFFLSLIVHNLRHFVNLLEDILMAVF